MVSRAGRTPTYFALVAYVTLGYDYDVAEIYPVGSDARWFVVSMFLIGVTLFVTALSVTLGPIVEGRMKGVMSLVKRFQRLSDHVVVCGYSGVAASVLDELRDRNVMVVIVDDREKVAQSLSGKGHDVLEADPTLRDTLLDANVLTAQAVIAAFDSDSTNRRSTPKTCATPRDARFAILVRIGPTSQLGVDQVISPSTAEQAVNLGAGSLSRAATRLDVTDPPARPLASLVTGGTRGLGRHIAAALLAAGARVANHRP